MNGPRFRVASADDASAIAAIYAPYVRDTVVSFETEPPDAAAMAARIETIGPRYPWIVADFEGEVVGYAYACEHRARAAYRWSVDAAAYVSPRHHRRGVGRALYVRLFALLRRQGHVNAFAGIALPNEASVGLHEALGFEPVGVYRDVGYKLGAWRDVGWWRLALGDAPDDPGDPVAFAALAAADVERALNP